MQRREEQIDELYEEIEKNMKLLGMTAIEDKLQDGVPECIERLKQAGMKIWMLTGDRIGKRFDLNTIFFKFYSLETAENVGFSCRLLTNDMMIARIEEETEEDVTIALDRFRNELIEKIERLFNITIDDRNKRLRLDSLGIDIEKFNQRTKNEVNLERFGGFGLLITGTALVHALSDQSKMKFLELSTMCKAVICCRVTPLQKAQVVELVMKNEKVITLAIGDGGNDVSMIQSELQLKIIMNRK
jgi:magnesium-transporting ATPase (P-type)